MRLITRKSECKKYVAERNIRTQQHTVNAIKQFTTLSYGITSKPISEHNQLVIFKTQLEGKHNNN
jgi:hypothetical protein